MNSLIASLPIHIPAPASLVAHADKLMLIGSCFSEHMGKRLADAKFDVLENPHGILFNPLSVCHSIQQYIDNNTPEHTRFVYLNETWNHWDFHSRFSELAQENAATLMSDSIRAGHDFLKTADWLMITLGSGFQYFLKEGAVPVANCHRAPGQWFDKRLLSIAEISSALKTTIEALQDFNPKLKIIFTISPVRHTRDGVVENNRSKARLIEAVHEMVALYPHCAYFPAYELLIDVLRDYRYYDVDLVHPNFAATQVVWEQFSQHFLSSDCQKTAADMQALSTARHHKVRFPETQAYAKFKANFYAKILQYEQQYPYINFESEKQYFGVE